MKEKNFLGHWLPQLPQQHLSPPILELSSAALHITKLHSSPAHHHPSNLGPVHAPFSYDAQFPTSHRERFPRTKGAYCAYDEQWGPHLLALSVSTSLGLQYWKSDATCSDEIKASPLMFQRDNGFSDNLQCWHPELPPPPPRAHALVNLLPPMLPVPTPSSFTHILFTQVLIYFHHFLFTPSPTGYIFLFIAPHAGSRVPKGLLVLPPSFYLRMCCLPPYAA